MCRQLSIKARKKNGYGSHDRTDGKQAMHFLNESGMKAVTDNCVPRRKRAHDNSSG